MSIQAFSEANEHLTVDQLINVAHGTQWWEDLF